jgi:hypothetical protein
VPPSNSNAAIPEDATAKAIKPLARILFILQLITKVLPLHPSINQENFVIKCR